MQIIWLYIIETEKFLEYKMFPLLMWHMVKNPKHTFC